MNEKEMDVFPVTLFGAKLLVKGYFFAVFENEKKMTQP